jgi:hypothetical protein
MNNFMRPFIRDGAPTWFGAVLFFGVDLGILGGIIFIVVHFLRKYW